MDLLAAIALLALVVTSGTIVVLEAVLGHRPIPARADATSHGPQHRRRTASVRS